MAIVYSDDDPISARWAGVNRLLTAYEVNYNFYQHETRLAALEASITVTVSIASISQPSANTLLVTMSDASTQGPFTLPVSTFNDRGAWATTTPYLINDTFTANGSLYRVLFDHTSGATFDPNANDGAGHDYYAAMLSSPGNALPNGGATAQVLQKSSGTDYAVTWGYKLPTGGSAGQALIKQSATNQNAIWDDIEAANVIFTPSTASGLTSTNVSDALEELATAGGTGGGGSGRQTLWIPASQMIPTPSHSPAAGSFQTYGTSPVVATLDFDSTTSESAQFNIALPDGWDKGEVSFRVFWSHATVGSPGGVVWEFDAGTIGPGISVNSSLDDSVRITVNEGTGDAADTLYVSAETDPLAIHDADTGDAPADHSLLYVQIGRVPSAADDTLGVDARLHGVQFLFTTV